MTGRARVASPPRSAAGQRLGRASDGDGFVTIQFVGVAALSLVLLTMLVNLVVFQYARAVVRTAMVEAARAGARTGGDRAACRHVAEQVLDDLLAGPIADDITVECQRSGADMVARSRVVLHPWLPGMSAWEFIQEAAAPSEPVS